MPSSFLKAAWRFISLAVPVVLQLTCLPVGCSASGTAADMSSGRLQCQSGVLGARSLPRLVGVEASVLESEVRGKGLPVSTL